MNIYAKPMLNVGVFHSLQDIFKPPSYGFVILQPF